MLPVVVGTKRQVSVQSEEQHRQNFRLWIGACLSTSLVFIPLIVFQNTKDEQLRVALYGFITTIVLSIAAYFVRETGNQTTREHDLARLLAIAAGVCTFIGLAGTIGHYEPFASAYLTVISLIAATIIRFRDRRGAAS